MDEGSGYCGSRGGIESVSDATLERDEICLVQCRVKKETEIFCRQGVVVGREKQGLTILEVFWGRLIRMNSV